MTTEETVYIKNGKIFNPQEPTQVLDKLSEKVVETQVFLVKARENLDEVKTQLALMYRLWTERADQCTHKHSSECLGDKPCQGCWCKSEHADRESFVCPDYVEGGGPSYSDSSYDDSVASGYSSAARREGYRVRRRVRDDPVPPPPPLPVAQPPRSVVTKVIGKKKKQKTPM